MPVATLAAIGTTVSVLNGTFTLGKQFLEIHAAPDEIRAAIEQLTFVKRELEYARHLRDKSFPDKTSSDFSNNADLIQLQDAIGSLANGIRRGERMLAAVDEKGSPKKATEGSVTVIDRFVWVMGNKGGFRDLYATLTIPHQTLSRSIEFLKTKRRGAQTPCRERTRIDESFLSPMQRQNRRGKSVDLPRNEDKGVGSSPRTAKLDFNIDDDGAAHRATSMPPDDTSSKPLRVAWKETQAAIDAPSHDNKRTYGSATDVDRTVIERAKRRKQGH